MSEPMIVCDPKVMMRKPVVAGTRITVGADRRVNRPPEGRRVRASDGARSSASDAGFARGA